MEETSGTCGSISPTNEGVSTFYMYINFVNNILGSLHLIYEMDK